MNRRVRRSKVNETLMTATYFSGLYYALRVLQISSDHFFLQGNYSVSTTAALLKKSVCHLFIGLELLRDFREHAPLLAENSERDVLVREYGLVREAQRGPGVGAGLS